MRVDLLEKLVLVLTVLTVVLVGSGVTLASVLLPGGLRSGIPPVASQSAVATERWLTSFRNKKGITVKLEGHYEPPRPRAQQQPGAGGGPAGGGAQAGGGGGEQRSAAQEEREVVTTFFGSNIPEHEQVRGIPWVRRVPGVYYPPPERVPELLYRKYQSFQDTWEEVQHGGGEFVETSAGTAYQVNWVEEQSYLYTKLGLRPGDRVIAVNGQPIGKSLNAGQAMFEQLKNERRFAVLIEREGQKTVLSFSVSD